MDRFYADEDISSLPQRSFEFLNNISCILFIEIMQGITGVYYVIVILNEYIFSDTSKKCMHIQSFFFRKHLQSIQSVLRKIKSIHLKSLFCKRDNAECQFWHKAAANSREFPSPFPRSSADCGMMLFGQLKLPDSSPRWNQHPVFPFVPKTAGHNSTNFQDTAFALRQKWCRMRVYFFPTR